MAAQANRTSAQTHTHTHTRTTYTGIGALIIANVIAVVAVVAVVVVVEFYLLPAVPDNETRRDSGWQLSLCGPPLDNSFGLYAVECTA